jgi:tetratricopeptide (TPR) repeat protein
MKRFFVFICIFIPIVSFAQKEDILSYDQCLGDINKVSIKKYKDAYSYFKNRQYQKSSIILQELINKEPDFASPYFLMGMIGVIKDNTSMIEKYFPLVKENCAEFSHPLLYYYLGMIDYTDEKYEQAQKDFEEFLKLSETINAYDSLQNIAINYIDWSDFLHTTIENRVAFNPKKINFLAENKNYYEPFITYDEKEIYFIRSEMTKDTNKDSFISSVSTTMKNVFCVSRLDSNGNYDRGFFEDLPFNSGKRESRVTITPDNNTMFFSKLNTDEDNKTWDIYMCEKFDGYWSEAKSININTKQFDEFSPSISSDGNVLYFVSNRSGGKGGYDIWYSTKNKDGSWNNPINMGSNVNTFLDENYPFIAADNESLYFLSNGWKTIGKSDIFYEDINRNQKPTNIGYGINTEENEHSIGVMLDGQTAYSTFKNQDNDYFEINTFILPENVRSKPMYIINGRINTEETEFNVSLQLLNITDNKVSSISLKNNQNPFTLTLAYNKTYLLSLNEIGYAFSTQLIKNDKDDISIDIKPIDYKDKIKINNITIDSHSKDFTDESAMVLNKFVSFMQVNNHIRINLYADRQISVLLKDFLLKSGIRDDRFQIIEISSPEVFYQIN